MVIRTTLVVVLLLLAACEPQDRRPGTWVSGEPVTGPVEDWSFSREYDEIYVETRPWYGIPHSVTTVVAAANDVLYVPSIYDEQAEFPGNKYWNAVIEDNPDVFLKIGDKRYPRRARLVTDEAEFDQALAALADKYAFWQNVQNNPDEAPPFVLIRMDDPSRCFDRGANRISRL